MVGDTAMKNILIGLGIGVLFLLYYLRIGPTLPITYYDEAWWIGDSYFFDLLLHDRRNPVWNSVYAYDQPKLVHYLFGMVLYPEFLYEKQSDKSLTYFRYLSNHKLLCYECIGDAYLPANTPVISRELFERNILSSEFAITRSFIMRVRMFNAVVAVLTVIAVYVLGIGLWGTGWALALAIWYGMNSLVIRTALLAHADALLLLFYSVAVTSLYWFIRKRSTAALFFFSVCTGLAASVKLSGFALVPLFVMMVLVDVLVGRKRQERFISLAKNTAVVLVVSLGLFILLNPPAQQPSFIIGFTEMLQHRGNQQAVFPIWYPDDSLPDNPTKLLSVFSGYFGLNPAPFSAPYPIASLGGWLSILYVSAFGIGLFAIGSRVRTSKRPLGDILYIPLLLCVMTLPTLVWLTVRWDRYYVLLALPILAIQIEGVRFIGMLCLRSVRYK